jgi:hypothetical protein
MATGHKTGGRVAGAGVTVPHPVELLITAVILAIVPYVLLHGPISRIARVVFAARPSVKQRLIR